MRYGGSMTVDVPVLDTARLTLRGHRASDLDDVLALWSDPEVTRYIGGKTSNREEVWARLLRYIGHWAFAGYGFWIVCERATGRFVGEVGMADFKRELSVSFEGAPEAGWVLAPSAQGRGYATEAMSAALAWNAARHPRTVCLIDLDNAPSRRVAAKLGYREITQAEYKGTPVGVFERSTS